MTFLRHCHTVERIESAMPYHRQPGVPFVAIDPFHLCHITYARRLITDVEQAPPRPSFFSSILRTGLPLHDQDGPAHGSNTHKTATLDGWTDWGAASAVIPDLSEL